MKKNFPYTGPKCLNALTLKLLAMGLMVCDHLWATILPGCTWLTNLGRLAYPIFAFQIVEGFYETHDRKQYGKRMLLFALLSEIPFDLMTEDVLFYPFHQNVMFTFFLAMLLMGWMERVRENRWKFLVVSVLCFILAYVLGILTMVDYFDGGILIVLLFYWTRGLRFGMLLQVLGLWYICSQILMGQVLTVTVFGHPVEFYQQSLALFSLIPIWLYNGERGYHSRAMQYAFYGFYPGHMLLLYFVRQFLLR